MQRSCIVQGRLLATPLNTQAGHVVASHHGPAMTLALDITPDWVASAMLSVPRLNGPASQSAGDPRRESLAARPDRTDDACRRPQSDWSLAGNLAWGRRVAVVGSRSSPITLPGGTGLDAPPPPPGRDPRPKTLQNLGRISAEFFRIFPACGATPRGGGGAPPTTLILLRNQRLGTPARRHLAQTVAWGRPPRPATLAVGGICEKREKFFFQ